jgi:chemotaxis protein methyltransferase CheR
MSALPHRTENEFNTLIDKVSSIVSRISGNVLGEKQSLMVQTRIKKRMSELGIHNPHDYIEYIEKHITEESNVLVSLITTHHTFFFREFAHFEFLKENLPDLVKSVRDRGENCLKLWSAAASRGQEVYSLAMFLNFYLPKIDPTMKFKIFGSDIDPESIKIAENGVYHRREIKSVPMNYLGEHWARGKGEISDFVKAKKSLTDNVHFKALNLLNFSNDIRNEKYDVIFCRNVFIYFESTQIVSITNKIFEHLHKDGIFFSGISESLSGLDLNIYNAGPSIYRHENFTKVKEAPEVIKTEAVVEDVSPTKVKVATIPEKLKVLCVDDSSSILTLLKKVFGEGNDFEVAGVAKNGIEAAEFLKNNKVDLMTLDIHMPEMDGVTYLEKHFGTSHPPVVMISSASRDDSDLAMRALRLGASDFVEKPALNNLLERGDEIKTKLKVAYLDKANFSSHVSAIDLEFEKHVLIENPELKFRTLLSTFSDKNKIINFFNELEGSQPPTIMFFEGQGELIEAYGEDLKTEIKHQIHYLDDASIEMQPGHIYLADFKEHYDLILKRFETRKTSIIIFGKCSQHASNKVLEWGNAQLLVEDLGVECEMTDVATDVVPTTSFAYMSTEYLSK